MRTIHGIRMVTCYVLSVLMFLGVATQALSVPAQASGGPVRITIETTLRHNTANPRNDSFTYRIQWRCNTLGQQVEYLTVNLAREGDHWFGRNQIELGDTSVVFTVTPLRGAARYINNPTSRRISAGSQNVTVRFTHTPEHIYNRDRPDPWDEQDRWDRWDEWDRWDLCNHWNRCMRWDCAFCRDRDWGRWDNLDRWDVCDRWSRCGRAGCIFCGGHNVVILDGSRDDLIGVGQFRPVDRAVPEATVNAMEAAARVATGNHAIVTERDRTSITPQRLRSLHNAAHRHGRTAVLHVDTMVSGGRSVQGRLTIEPGRLLERTTNLSLGVYTEAQVTRPVHDVFRRTFSNRIAVVTLVQQGDLGARMRVAALVDLTGLNANTLRFYSYDRESGRTVSLSEPAHHIDSNGYLIFHTSRGGDIIITDRPLTRN